MAEFNKIEAKELELFEEFYFDKFRVPEHRGVFRTAKLNIKAAIEAGWFKNEFNLEDLSARERASLSREIDQKYDSYLPFDRQGRPTDPNVSLP